MSSSDVIAIVAGVIVTALIIKSGKASHRRRTARFGSLQRRHIGPVSPPPPPPPKPPDGL